INDAGPPVHAAAHFERRVPAFERTRCGYVSRRLNFTAGELAGVIRNETVSSAIQGYSSHGEDLTDSAIELFRPFVVIGMIHQGNKWQVGKMGVNHQLTGLEIEGIVASHQRRGAPKHNQEFLVPTGNFVDQFLMSLVQLDRKSVV